MIAPTPPMKLMMPLACERNGEGVMSGMRATTGVRHSAMLNSSVEVPATNNGRTLATGMMQRRRADGRADEDEWHAPPDGRAQLVGPRAHGRLDEQRGDVVQRHEEADERGREMELLGEEDRDEGVVYAPDHAHAEKAEAEQEGLAVVKPHPHFLRLCMGQ